MIIFESCKYMHVCICLADLKGSIELFLCDVDEYAPWRHVCCMCIRPQPTGVDDVIQVLLWSVEGGQVGRGPRKGERVGTAGQQASHTHHRVWNCMETQMDDLPIIVITNYDVHVNWDGKVTKTG